MSEPSPIREITTPRLLAELVLSQSDKMVRAMILPRQGRENAIKIEEIGRTLWPEEWEQGRDRVIRSIKESVERLRIFCGERIVASKVKPYGYFIAASAEEADEYAERMFREGVKLLRIARLFSPKRDWVQEMRGQIAMPVTSDK